MDNQFKVISILKKAKLNQNWFSTSEQSPYD